jgi:YfiH family protein
VSVVRWEEASEFGASIAVTTRQGGVSEGPYESLNLGLHVGDDVEHVLANRERAARSFGVALGTMVFAEQVHGAGVGVVGPADHGRGSATMADAVAGTDILVTRSVGTTLVMLVADCVPVALVDPDARILAVVHAGWRGTAGRAVAHAIDAMAQLGGDPGRTVAFLGPAVAAERYQVTAEVPRALAEAVAPTALAPGVVRPDGADHWRVDLIAANRQQLTEAGVDPARMYESGHTTADEAFFSDRAARPCGRFGLMAQLLA